MMQNICTMVGSVIGQRYVRLIGDYTLRIYNQFGHTDYNIHPELLVGMNDEDIVKEILKDYVV